MDRLKKSTARHVDKGADEKAGRFGALVNGVGIVFAVGILASAGILVLEVVLRYLFNAPTIWAHETVIFLTATAFVFGGLYVASRNAHIRVVLIYDAFSPAAKRRADIGISLACAFSTAFFAWAAWKVVLRAVLTPSGALRFETSGSAWNPPFPGLLKVFLFVMLIAMSLQFLIFAWSFYRAKARDEEEEA